MVLATSEYFWADLGSLDQALESRVAEWARGAFDACAVLRTPGGRVELYARRGEPRSSKSLKMMLRSLFHNWNQALEMEDNSWLQLLTREEFLRAAGGAEEESRAPPPSESTPTADAPSPPRRVWEGVFGALPPDFDERALRAYHQLKGQRLVPCRA